MGTSEFNVGDITLLASHPIRVEIFQVASCCTNQDKLRPNDFMHGSSADLYLGTSFTGWNQKLIDKMRDVFILLYYFSTSGKSVSRTSSDFNAYAYLQQKRSSSIRQKKSHKCHVWTWSCSVSERGKTKIKLNKEIHSVQGKRDRSPWELQQVPHLFFFHCPFATSETRKALRRVSSRSPLWDR